MLDVQLVSKLVDALFQHRYYVIPFLGQYRKNSASDSNTFTECSPREVGEPVYEVYSPVFVRTHNVVEGTGGCGYYCLTFFRLTKPQECEMLFGENT